MKDRGERLNSAPRRRHFFFFHRARVTSFIHQLVYRGCLFIIWLSSSFSFVSDSSWAKQFKTRRQKTHHRSLLLLLAIYFSFSCLMKAAPLSGERRRRSRSCLLSLILLHHEFVCFLFCFVFSYFIFCLILPLQYEGRNFDKTDRQTHTARLRKCVCSVVCVAESFFFFP